MFFFFLGLLSALDEPMFRVLATVLDIHAILLAENIHCWFGRAHGIFDKKENIESIQTFKV